MNPLLRPISTMSVATDRPHLMGMRLVVVLVVMLVMMLVMAMTMQTIKLR